MKEENDNVVTGEILSSADERDNKDTSDFENEFYHQFQIKRIKMWHIFLILAIILLIIGLSVYIFIKYIEVFLIIIIFVLSLKFVKGLVK